MKNWKSTCTFHQSVTLIEKCISILFPSKHVSSCTLVVYEQNSSETGKEWSKAAADPDRLNTKNVRY